MDFSVNEIGLAPDTYGTVCIKTNAVIAGAWSGGITMYRPNMQSGGGMDFALNYPIMKPRTGIYTLPLNTFHLGTARENTVANWINITDARPGDGRRLQGKIEYYNSQGKVVRIQAVDIADGGRYDFSGHDALAGPKNTDQVGMAVFTPKTAKGKLTEYYITNTRYFYECPAHLCTDFLTAFVLPHRPPTTKTTFGGVSTTNGEISVVELNNVTQTSVKSLLRFYDRKGKPLGTQSVNVPPRATRHIIVNKVGETGFLGENAVGSVEVSTKNGYISASTLFYRLE